MARVISNVLLLTIQCMLLDCTRRTKRLVYKPYGPQMCRQLCQDLGGTFFYLPENFSCHRVPTSADSIKDSLRDCLKQDLTGNNAPVSITKTDMKGYKDPHKDARQFNLLQSMTQPTAGRNVKSGHITHNISLHQACVEGDLCTVQYILSQRPTAINTLGEQGRTPVMEAVLNNQVSIFNFLVSQRCDLLSVDNKNDTVLHLACAVGNVDIVTKLVVNHTCDIESRGSQGMTPVMLSALHGHEDVVDFLVSKGCNVTARDDNMNNILHVACSGGHVEMVKYVLIELNSDKESKGEKGRTPLLIAAHSGHVGVLEFLVKNGSNHSAVDDNKDNILHVASMGGHVDMVQHILNKSYIDIEAEASYGRTPVMRAAQYGQRSVVDFLVRKQCNINVVDDNMNTLLHVACSEGRLAMVKHIVSNMNFPVDSRGQNGLTPVMTAALKCHLGVVKYLVSKGCTLTKGRKYTHNVLHYACTGGNVDIVKFILSNTTLRIDSKGGNSLTPVMIAAVHGNLNVVKYLVNKGCQVGSTVQRRSNVFHYSCINGNLGIVKFILSHTAITVDSRTSLGQTPVMIAAYRGHLNVVKYLVRRGCNVKLVDKRGKNVLHTASEYGQIDIVKYIYSQTKNLTNSRDQSGQTAVISAALRGHFNVVKYLVRRGCNVQLVDKRGKNVLHVASEHGRIDIVKYICSQTKNLTNSRDQSGQTPVMSAALRSHFHVVKYLVNRGCNVTILSATRDNVLHFASKSDRVDIVKFLLSNTRIAIDSRGRCGWTPVMEAASLGHINVVKYLVSKGCNITQVDDLGENVLEIACNLYQKDVVEYLFSIRSWSKHC